MRDVANANLMYLKAFLFAVIGAVSALLLGERQQYTDDDRQTTAGR